MSKAPDFILKAKNTKTGQVAPRVGAAWANGDGSISIALDMCIVLQSDPNIQLTLFPFQRLPFIPQPDNGREKPIPLTKENQ